LRLILILIGLMTALPGFGAEILILVRAKEAGPVLHEGMYREPTWVLWPVADDPAQFNRMLALPSGVDWQSDMLGGDFDGLPTQAMAERWRALGYFDATRKNVGIRRLFAVRPTKRPTDPLALAAAWREPEVREIGEAASWPERSMLVAVATGPNPWDEVAKLIQKAGGRAMVVEVPDDRGTMWTRLWLRGKGWPEGVPKTDASSLPGLVEARHAMGLLADPARAKWTEAMSDPPNEWLAYGHRTAPVVLVFLAVAGVYALGLAVYMALREQYSRTALFLLRLLVLGPAAIILAGKATSLTGISGWAPALAASFVGLFFAAWVANKVASIWLSDQHLLWGEFALGLFVVAGVDPTWSMFSSLIGPHRSPVSPEAFGALASYAVGANYLFSERPFPRFLWGTVAISAVLDLLVLSHWASPMHSAGIPLAIAALCRPAVIRPLVWIPMMVGIGILGAFVWPGLVYAPDHLVHSYSQVGKFNCAEQIAFLMSPMFITFAIVGLIVAIVGGSFLGHQVRRAMSFSPKSKPFFAAAIGFGVAGIFIPLLLHAALATAIAGGVAVLFDAVRVP
jgi:hypothetical protein